MVFNTEKCHVTSFGKSLKILSELRSNSLQESDMNKDLRKMINNRLSPKDQISKGKKTYII